MSIKLLYHNFLLTVSNTQQSVENKLEVDCNQKSIIWKKAHDSKQMEASSSFTCRDHAVSMGGGWQAVTGRAVVHEDRQRWICGQGGERVSTKRLACHILWNTQNSSSCTQMLVLQQFYCLWFFLTLFGLVHHCLFLSFTSVLHSSSLVFPLVLLVMSALSSLFLFCSLSLAATLPLQDCLLILSFSPWISRAYVSLQAQGNIWGQ